MKFPHLLICFCFVSLTWASCRDATKAKSFEQLTDSLQDHFVADSRVDKFVLEYKSGFQGLYLTGYTTIPAAFDSLQATLANGFVVAQNEFRLLPDAALLEGKTAGIINVSVANLRSAPGHSQELATQALLGTPIEVLDLQEGWYLVRTPDRYLAWLEPGAFVASKPRQVQAYLESPQGVMFTAPAGFLTAEVSGGTIVTDLVYGNLLVATGKVTEGMAELALFDGTTGWVDSTLIVPRPGNPAAIDPDKLLTTAAELAGRPYLWGGTSPKGMDCSGFTKTAYYLNGYVIPRDASQQVHAGTEVELTVDFKNLLPGDLLFFGRYRTDGSEKITHVGFYLGEGRFLHAGADNGRIMEQSLFPQDAAFAEHRLKSLLRARRLAANTSGVVPVTQAFSKLIGD